MAMARDTSGRVRPFQLRAVNGLDVFQLGPRTHRPGNSRELSLSVFHRTLGGAVGVLIAPEQIGILTQWFTGTLTEDHHEGGPPVPVPQPDGSFQEPTVYYREFNVMSTVWLLRDLQTSAKAMSLKNGGCVVRSWWHGSGRSRSAELSAEDRRAVGAFLTRFDRDGWATGGVTYEGDGK